MKFLSLLTASILALGTSLVAEETAKTIAIIDNSAVEVQVSEENQNALASLVAEDKEILLTGTVSESGLAVASVEEKPTASVVLIVDGKPYKANVSEIFAEYVVQNAEANNFKVVTNLSEITSLELIAKPVVVEEVEEEFAEVDDEDLFKKVGFLTSEDCAIKGHFKDCYAESYVCGYEGCHKDIGVGEVRPVQLVLFVHDDGKYYKVRLTDSIKLEDIDGGVGRNEVTIIGEFNEDQNVIEATEFKAPPPPKKSFFKGCL